MRIAVVGSGISGLAASWLASREHEVVLFESAGRLGGHTHTHEVIQAGRTYAIDTGFIVFNPPNYPLLSRLFEELGVASLPTTMSFSVHDARSGLEYNATDFNSLFSQRRNLVSLKFWRMVRDILRFHREAPALLEGADEGPTLGEYLADRAYSPMFIENHLLPMASALWSTPSSQVLDFPARYLVAFMDNHRMLQISGRPEWRVVAGGSSRYIDAMTAGWPVQVRTSSPVTRVSRNASGVRVAGPWGEEDFDRIILACHADQALAILADPSDQEREILAAFQYQENETVLHTDRSLLPRHPRAWAAWNAHVPREPNGGCTVSYCMNLLQSIESEEPFVVTLNRSHAIDPARVIARMQYQHPLYTAASIAAQQRRAEINGQRHTFYAGAYWGFGFHEDGMRSGVDVARELGVHWP